MWIVKSQKLVYSTKPAMGTNSKYLLIIEFPFEAMFYLGERKFWYGSNLVTTDFFWATCPTFLAILGLITHTKLIPVTCHYCTSTEQQPTLQARSHGGAFGGNASSNFFSLPPNRVPRKYYFSKHIIKRKILPLKCVLPPSNHKTWLQAWWKLDG